ncbi:Periplasmic pH-dependent serine endoprotease DegQ [wastewater metagenome]|uniref:Periplasmic pH-dependent serine endoprotease DegQ n=2 Tax=unclassified sequences TaxID=12908 RepID=A0A5B8R795_9ZZZZ|nr:MULTISPECIES: trypsin-like peptidase domain-containing protein [Arhodomonas]MCS4504724.1 trypsin-like peptidase domain-containing protein [Arhodomonas aquaeolei]QEA04959.1 periplasmic pH-dependent serine endoprotease DegQ [uncultured organism]
MPGSRIGRFVLRYVVVGVLAALAAVWLAPEVFTPPAPVVRVSEAPSADGSAPTPPRPASYADAVERAAPAVVNVYTTRAPEQRHHPFFDDPQLRRFFGAPKEQRPERSLGSGVIVSPDGYVLTNEHVVRDADAIEVLLSDGRAATAEVVGSDPDTDLAVLDVGLGELPHATFGDSTALRVGDIVLAVGNPFGVGQTVTQGIVSATGRDHLGLATFENFIQTDAAINPGNSGGALINAAGELVGINTAIYSRSGGSMGIGFAIPVSLARGVMRELIEQGHVTRGWIGVQVQPMTPPLADTLSLPDVGGVLIAGVLRGGPAHEAGIQPGDVILSIDEHPVDGPTQLLNRISGLSPGSEAVVAGIGRDGRFNRRVTIGRRPTGGG